MRFEAFQARAREIFEDVPEEYKEGIDGLDVTRRTVSHPSLPDVFTLGECLSEFYPSDYGGPGEVRSRVVLYYGSFLELSRRDEDWDWEHEIWETITHELRHHLEHLASEDALEEMDYAEDQNFARREGETFDPFFFRAGEKIDVDVFKVDGDVFIERELESTRKGEIGATTSIEWQGERITVVLPADGELGDVHFLRLEEAVPGVDGDFHLVLVRRRGFGAWMRGLLSGARLQVTESMARAERADAGSR